MGFFDYLIDYSITRYQSKEVFMTVTISPKFQVVIPKEIRCKLKLKSGQKVEMLYYDKRIELIPIEPIRNLRGIVAGMNTDVERDEDRV